MRLTLEQIAAIRLRVSEHVEEYPNMGGDMPDLLDTIDVITAERDVARGRALLDAAAIAAKEPRVWDKEAPPPQQRICAKILALSHDAIRRAEEHEPPESWMCPGALVEHDKQVAAEARRDESEWWHASDIYAPHHPVCHCSCHKCLRLKANRLAALPVSGQAVPDHRPYSDAILDAERALMRNMHDDLENCLAEGKDPVLLLVVWRDAIAKAGQVEAKETK
jgi:hypothetical protein